MPSFTFSSEARFAATLLLTFGVLCGTWETVLRKKASANVDYSLTDNSAPQGATRADEQWLVFGNCLMMTGVSPRQLGAELGAAPGRRITNISLHEESPIAFFEYLEGADYYPEVIVANVSSWLNGTNFEQEGNLLTNSDPLNLRPPPVSAPHHETDAFRDDESSPQGTPQQHVEAALTSWTTKHAQAVGHRYHLFDYTLFLGALVTSASLDDALYQLNMQSWFRVEGSETDGLGWLGLRVDYRDSWPRGVEQMTKRSLQRLELSRSLTPHYWELLESEIKRFVAHGTKVVLVRMPEEPGIRAFNDRVYAMDAKLGTLGEATGALTIDLSTMGVEDGVRLFDAVHPDDRAAEVITHRLADFLKAHGFSAKP